MAPEIEIRLALVDDLVCIMKLFDASKTYMRSYGNMTQWTNGYPSEKLILRDILAGKMYCVQTDKVVHGVFFWSIEDDIYYQNIENVAWNYSTPYGVIHRLAGDGHIKRLGEIVIKWCMSQFHHIRIDTHSSNAPMRQLMEILGFRYCGIIYVADGTPRIAYDWSVE